MSEVQFWQVVGQARDKVPDPVRDADEVAEGVVALLSARPLEEILAFQVAYDGVTDPAWHWDLWAAAAVIGDGVSGDGFASFLGWLVAQGQAVFEQALRDPDSLAAVLDPEFREPECETMLAAASSAYGVATGDPQSFWAVVPESEGPGEPTGEELDPGDEERMRRLLPRLVALYAEDSESEDSGR